MLFYVFSVTKQEGLSFQQTPVDTRRPAQAARSRPTAEQPAQAAWNRPSAEQPAPVSNSVTIFIIHGAVPGPISVIASLYIAAVDTKSFYL